MVNKFYETGRVHDNRALVGAKLTAHRKSHTSITRLSQQLGVSWSTTYCIVRHDIGLFLYKVHVAQKLTPYSKERRLNFAQDFIAVLALKPSMLNNIWFTYECHYWLNGYIKKQNMPLWAENNPNKIEEAPLQPTKITVWAAFSSCRIIGPVFIRDMVMSESYHSFLADDITPELENWC